MDLNPNKKLRGPRPDKSRRLLHALREGIATGHYRVDTYLPGEVTLAAVFAANRKTVQKVLQELAAAGIVRSEPRRGWRVLMGCDSVGGRRVQFYENNKLQGRRVLPVLTRQLEANGFTLQIVFEDPRAQTLARDPFSSALRGVMWYSGTPASAEFINACRRQAIVPVGIMHAAATDYDTICCDHFGGMALLLRRLIEQGRRRIAFITSTKLESTADVSFRQRRAGYEYFMRAAGLEPLILELSGYHGEQDNRLIQQWLKAENKLGLDALFCMVLPVLWPVLTVLHSEGICAGTRYIIATAAHSAPSCLLDAHQIRSLPTINVRTESLVAAAVERFLFRYTHGMQSPPSCMLLNCEVLDLCAHRQEDDASSHFE